MENPDYNEVWVNLTEDDGDEEQEERLDLLSGINNGEKQPIVNSRVLFSRRFHQEHNKNSMSIPKRHESFITGRKKKNLKKRRKVPKKGGDGRKRPRKQPSIHKRINQNMYPYRHFNTRSMFELRNKLVVDQSGRRRFLTVGLNYECNVFRKFKDCVNVLKQALTSRLHKEKNNHHHHHIVEPFWIDVQSPTKKDMEMMEVFFHLHKLTVEDCLDNDSGEKMELFPNYLFVCVRTVDKVVLKKFEELNVIVFKRFVITVHRGYFEEIDLVLKRIMDEIESGLSENEENHFLKNHIHKNTPHDLHHHDEVEEVEGEHPHHHHHHSNEEDEKENEEEIEIEPPNILRLYQQSPSPGPIEPEPHYNSSTLLRFKLPRIPHGSWILYAFLDVMTDSYVPLSEKLLMEVESLDEEVLDDNSTKTSSQTDSLLPQKKQYRLSKTDLLRQLGISQKKINRMKKLLKTKQAIVQLLMSPGTERYISNETLMYIRDVVDHLSQCLQHLESAKESLKQNHSNYMTRVSIDIAKSSKKTDVFMGKVELFVALFTPVACVAGIWGMNMPVPWQFSDTNMSLWYFFWILLVSFAVSILTVFWLNPYILSDAVKKLLGLCSQSTEKKENKEEKRARELKEYFDRVDV